MSFHDDYSILSYGRKTKFPSRSIMIFKIYCSQFRLSFSYNLRNFPNTDTGMGLVKVILQPVWPKDFKATNINKIFSGYQPCQFVTNRRFRDQLRPHHQDLTRLIAREQFIILQCDDALMSKYSCQEKYMHVWKWIKLLCWLKNNLN
jgi:hypothetical protein